MHHVGTYIKGANTVDLMTVRKNVLICQSMAGAYLDHDIFLINALMMLCYFIVRVEKGITFLTWQTEGQAACR